MTNSTKRRLTLGASATAIAALGLHLLRSFPAGREAEHPPSTASSKPSTRPVTMSAAPGPVTINGVSQASNNTPPPALDNTPPAARVELSEEELIMKNEDDQNKKAFDGFAESMEQRLERAHERYELLGRWNNEAPDASWSSQLSSRIHYLLGNENFSSDHLKEVDCRQTVCRFQLRTSNNTHAEVMKLIRVARDLGEETWVRAEPHETAPESHIEVFFPREGYRLSGGGGRIDESPVVHAIEADVDEASPEQG